MASLLAVAFATCSMTLASAAPGLTVAAIQRDGAATASVPDVMLRSKGVEAAHVSALALQQELPEGVEIIIPIRTVITFKSSNGNTITLQPGSRFTVRHVGDDGESYTLDDGSVSFDVVKALNFFNVNYRKFLAIVKGTKFSVAVEPEKEIRFAVTEGTVVVQREVKVLIREQGQDEKTTEFTTQELLRPDKQNSSKYSLNVDEYLREFNSFKDAEQYFRKQLMESEASNSPQRRMVAMRELSTVLALLGKPKESLTQLMAAVKLADRGTVDEADLLRLVGQVYLDLREYDRAHEYFERALHVYESANSGSVPPCIACAQQGIGIALGARGNYIRALEHFTQAINIRRVAGEAEDSPDLLKLRANMAHVYQNIGETGRAGELISGIHSDVLKRYPTRRHPHVIQSFNALSSINLQKGDRLAAIDYAKAALSIASELYPRGVHPLAARSEHLIGMGYGALGDFRQSLSHFESANKILQQSYADMNHVALLQSYLMLARSYGFNRRADSAKQAYRIALTLASLADLDESPLTRAESFLQLGRASIGEGDMLGAVRYLNRSIEEFQTLRPAPNERFVANSYLYLASAQSKMGAYADAAISAEKATAMFEAGYGGRPNENTAQAAWVTARQFRELHDYRQAIDYLKRSLLTSAAADSSLARSSVAARKVDLGDVLRLSGDLKAAVASYDEALQMMTQLIYGETHEEVASLQVKLFLAWTALGDEQKANHYARDAQATRDRLSVQAEAATRKEP